MSQITLSAPKPHMQSSTRPSIIITWHTQGWFSYREPVLLTCQHLCWQSYPCHILAFMLCHKAAFSHTSNVQTMVCKTTLRAHRQNPHNTHWSHFGLSNMKWQKMKCLQRAQTSNACSKHSPANGSVNWLYKLSP